jgi:hypothetical protein
MSGVLVSLRWNQSNRVYKAANLTALCGVGLANCKSDREFYRSTQSLKENHMRRASGFVFCDCFAAISSWSSGAMIDNHIGFK